MTTSFTFGSTNSSAGTPATAAPLFGTTPSLFGGTTPAPSSGGLFGGSSSTSSNPTTPAPFSFAPSAAAPASLFGAAPQQQQQQPPNHNNVVAQPPTIAGNMYYSQLTPDMQRAIDMMHTAMLQHKKTIHQLQTIGPQLLQPTTASNTSNITTTTTKSTTTTPLQQQIEKLQQRLQQLDEVEMPALRTMLSQQYHASEQMHVTTTLYATWPVEGLAARMGIPLQQQQQDPNHQNYDPNSNAAATGTTTTNPSHIDENKEKDPTIRYSDPQVQEKIRRALMLGMAAVDRIDRMPSPYFWDIIQQLERRAQQLQADVHRWVAQQKDHHHSQPNEWNLQAMEETIEDQHIRLCRLQQQLVPQIRDAMELLKLRYRLAVGDTGDNVLDQQKIKEQQRRTQVQEQLLRQFLQATANNNGNPHPAAPNATSAPAPAPAFGTPAAATTTTTGLFGTPSTSTNTPSFSFGNSNNNPAASATNSSSSSANPTTTFGSTTPAPAPLFGGGTTTTTTPAVPTFGTTNTNAFAAPTFGGSTTTTTATTTSQNRKSKSNSRAGGRLRR